MKVGWLVILAETAVVKWWEDNALRLSAALSYYTLFSLAPLLTVAVTFAGLVANANVVQSEMLDRIQGMVGQPGADVISNMLESASQPVQGTTATVVSLVTLIIVATGMFSELQDALNLIWRIPSTGSAALRGAVNTRLFSFVLVIGAGFLLLVSLIVSTFLGAFGKVVLRAVAGPQVLLTFVDGVVSLPVVTLLFALMFKVLPEGHIAWRDVWLGAMVSGALFMIGKWAIGLYLGSAAMTSMYGPASSLMAILAWVYYSAIIFFLGAEFACVYADLYGSRVSHRIEEAVKHND